MTKQWTVHPHTTMYCMSSQRMKPAAPPPIAEKNNGTKQNGTKAVKNYARPNPGELWMPKSIFSLNSSYDADAGRMIWFAHVLAIGNGEE